MAEVALERIVKVYPGGVRAVGNVSLEIIDREFITLVGPSGCGKSTTLRLVAGLEALDSGFIRIDGRVVNEVPPKDRDIAMVFQNYALYPHMTVYKNMAFGLKLRKFPRAQIDQRVREVARMLDIEELLDHKPKALSGGQRQRVAVGRAIVRTPKAFLFDEPLSNLDAKLRVEMRAELKKLHRKLGATTIYVTHDQEEAMTLGDRVVVMKDGVIHQCAAPLEVYEQPANRFVAGFVGTPPMNFLDGRLLSEDGQLYFDEGTARFRLPGRFNGVLSSREGEQMVMGIRPEQMACNPQGRFAGEENRLDVTISEVETLGDKMDLHVQTGCHEQLICRVDVDRDLADGQNTTLHLDMQRVHFFEPGDEGVNVCVNRMGELVSAA